MKKYLILFLVGSVLFILPMKFKEEEVCHVTIRIANTTDEMTLDEYVLGVISAEIHASFHEEAIKAQAVAARTYALVKTDFGQKPIAASTLHQVFHTEDERREKWQGSFDMYEQKMADAVSETKDEVLYYNGQLITAMFHAASSGQTESAKNYSGYDTPYLQSVVSFEEEHSEIFYTYEQLNERLGVQWTPAQYKALQVERNSSQRVATIYAGAKSWTGREFRQLLSLKSTAFSLSYTTEGVNFVVEGYGHGVGLSQLGANVLAEQGKKYDEILLHYYKDVKLEKIPAIACLN